MLFTRLLLVNLIVLLAGRTAASQQINNDVLHAAVGNGNYIRPFTPATHLRGLLESASPRVAQYESSPGDDDFQTDSVCLTLDTFVIARYSKNSDETHVVAHRTCTMGRRFQMKSADLHPNE
jgi:hypothetical protein